MSKFSPGDKVRIVALLSQFSGEEGTVKSILSRDATSTKYIVSMDKIGEEFVFSEWELGRPPRERPTQSRFISRRD